MATLNQDPGPSNVLAGVMPSLPEERQGRQHWLVFSACNVYACHTTSSDLARALVLDRFGYGARPELAEELDARPASGREVTAVCSRRRQRPLKVDARNANRIGRLARLIYVADLRHAGSDRDGAAISSSGTATRKATRRAIARMTSDESTTTPSDRVKSR